MAETICTNRDCPLKNICLTFRRVPATAGGQPYAYFEYENPENPTCEHFELVGPSDTLAPATQEWEAT